MGPEVLQLVALLVVTCPCAAFLVERAVALNISSEFPFLFNRTTVTHQDMTTEAILQVARQVLIANPSDGESSTRVNGLAQLTARDLVVAYHNGTSIDDFVGFQVAFLDAINDINDASFNVELGPEADDAAAHFYNEIFQLAQNRLVALRQNVVTHIMNEDYELARTETGRMLHTLQDFYSNTNWIENGNSQPYDVLGRMGQRPGLIASPVMETCLNCAMDGSITIQPFSSPGFSVERFTCSNNVVIRNLLTSG